MTRITIVFVIASLTACSTGLDNGGTALPSDIDSLQTLLDETNNQLRDLQSRADQIASRIKELQPDDATQRRLVTAKQVQRKDFRQFARIQGMIESKDLISVTSELSGRLTSVRVEEGHGVRRGQLIATMDTTTLSKQRDELKTQLELAQDIFERQKRLWDQNIGSEVQYLQAKNNVERLEKSIETLEYNMSKAWIYAPLSGVVDMVGLKTGQLAQPGMPVITILDTRNVKVVADAPENYLGKVKRGDMVEISFPALDETISAPVTLIGRKIDQANRTFKIEVDLKSSGNLYKPNLLAEVMINDYTEEDVLVISQELVQQEVGGRNFVMVVNEEDGDARARKVYITLGKSYEGEVVVADGLAGDERIIMSGSRGLTNGEAIVVQQVQDSIDG